MKILFILYGDLLTNTANPIALFTKELKKLGHECVIAIPSGIENKPSLDVTSFTTVLYSDIFKRKGEVFSGELKADIIHACTPRIGVVNFLRQYLSKWPTPLIFYLEDNEFGIAASYLDSDENTLYSMSNSELNLRIPEMLSHPFEHEFYLSLADLIIVIQEKLNILAPATVEKRTVSWGVDQSVFNPNVVPSERWRAICNIQRTDNVIVYHGGLNGITRGPIRDLCQAVQLINQTGVSCKLLRTGPNNINFWDDLEPNSRKYIKELGLINRDELPSVLALANIFVQPGRINDFEDLRLPSKLPEFFSMGKPVILPKVNISNLLKNNIDAIIIDTGQPIEIAHACLNLFKHPKISMQLGMQARKFAELHFDIETQTIKLLSAYELAIANFNLLETKFLWDQINSGDVCEAALKKN
jgi:glycosyltransferase involved in cell wall biosynthesis